MSELEVVLRRRRRNGRHVPHRVETPHRVGELAHAGRIHRHPSPSPGEIEKVTFRAEVTGMAALRRIRTGTGHFPDPDPSVDGALKPAQARPCFFDSLEHRRSRLQGVRIRTSVHIIGPGDRHAPKSGRCVRRRRERPPARRLPGPAITPGEEGRRRGLRDVWGTDGAGRPCSLECRQAHCRRAGAAVARQALVHAQMKYGDQYRRARSLAVRGGRGGQASDRPLGTASASTSRDRSSPSERSSPCPPSGASPACSREVAR